MQPRIATLPALLGTLLVLVATHASADPSPPNPHAVTKCIVNGVTTYSDKPCPDGTAERPMNDHPVVIALEKRSTRSIRSARCDAAEAELHNIDALTRQGQPADMQAFLDARRQQKRNEQFRYRC